MAEKFSRFTVLVSNWEEMAEFNGINQKNLQFFSITNILNSSFKVNVHENQTMYLHTHIDINITFGKLFTYYINYKLCYKRERN